MSKLLAIQTGTGLTTSDRVEVDYVQLDGGAAGARIKLFDTGVLLAAAEAGLAFGNQPATDGVEIVSSSALDVQTATIYGTRAGASTTLVSETITLTGVTFVPTVIVNWENILGVELSSAAVGTITVREASGDATITTIAPLGTQSGVVTPSDTDDFASTASLSFVRVFASGATTKYVGIVGTNSSDAAQMEVLTLAGAALVNGASTFKTVTKVLVGHVESTRNVTAFAGVRLVQLAALTGDTRRTPYYDNLSFKYGIYCFSTVTDSTVDIYTTGFYD